MTPKFLSVQEVLEIHQDQIDRYGGGSGVRDMGLLESAIAMPAAGFGEEYLHKDLFEMAAAYVFHIVQNHPFVDGNKRTGSLAADVFLATNGVQMHADQELFEELVLNVAEGKAGKPEIAGFLRTQSGA